MPKCECVIVNRQPDESERDWLKRCMCMHHWVQTDYYLRKLDRKVENASNPYSKG